MVGHKMKTVCWLIAAVCYLAGMPCQAADELLVNGDFSKGLEGWAEPWSREPGIKATVDPKGGREGQPRLSVEHPIARDWAIAQAKPLDVKPGEIYAFTGWLRTDGKGGVGLSVVLYDAQEKVIDWSYGAQRVFDGSGWLRVDARFAVPKGAAKMLPRISGYDEQTAWVEGLSLKSDGRIDLDTMAGFGQLGLKNRSLSVSIDPSQGSFTITDLRNQQVYRQRIDKNYQVIREAGSTRRSRLTLLDIASASQFDVKLELDGDKPELIVEVTGEGPLKRLRYPHPFVSPAGSWLVMPVNEGIAYPVDETTLPEMYYHLYGGHGLCMPWYGLTDRERGLMTLVETPDDAAVHVPRRDERLLLAPEWLPQRGRFGYARRLRYVVFDKGSYVAMAKRHRAHAKATGLLRTLEEKRRENPNVDLLVGAANVWNWESDGPRLCRELQGSGIERILWSGGGSAEQLRQLNERPGVLTSRYDIYQDCMDPANFPKLRSIHPDWTSDGWPKDIMREPDGDWTRGWWVEGKRGEQLYCGVLCDQVAPDYARRRISEELKARPYRCRFIDTTTASEWRECYAPSHPLDRSQSKRLRMELLDVVSREQKLVTGSETGHEAAVPYLHYFEGMLSLGPYRLEDAGRNTARIVEEVPEQVARFQTGHYYRLPLWELVYHDCVVSHWYWGDYNNKLPALWDRRDLWNALYGTPPMFMFDRKFWREHRERFVRSYEATSPVARATGYREMLSHAWLSEDHSIQQTRFAGGIVVTVNFGDKPYELADGTMLAPLKQRVEGVGE